MRRDPAPQSTRKQMRARRRREGETDSFRLGGAWPPYALAASMAGGWLRSIAPALPRNFVQDYSRGHGNVQRRHLPQHWDRDQKVAFLAHQLVQAFAFR